MPLTTNRARVIKLPFQSCEHCPGKSWRISPWVQMVEHPKYALHRETDKKAIKNSVMTQIKAFFLYCKYTHKHLYLCCPLSLREGMIPQSSSWVQLLSHHGRAYCRSACSASGPTPAQQQQKDSFWKGLTVYRSLCEEPTVGFSWSDVHRVRG